MSATTAGSDSLKDAFHDRIVFETVKEQGDSQYNNEDGKIVPNAVIILPPDSTQLISYEDRNIDCQNSRCGLGDSQQIDQNLPAQSISVW